MPSPKKETQNNPYLYKREEKMKWNFLFYNSSNTASQICDWFIPFRFYMILRHTIFTYLQKYNTANNFHDCKQNTWKTNKQTKQGYRVASFSLAEPFSIFAGNNAMLYPSMNIKLQDAESYIWNVKFDHKKFLLSTDGQ